MAELTRLEIRVPESSQDALSGVLALFLSYGWEEEVALSGDEVTYIIHTGHYGLAVELQETIKLYFPFASIRSFQVEEENWCEAWKEFFTPVEGGTHFLVIAPWMEEERANTKRTPIIIEPKMAFGTGHHATTALCLETISSLFMDKLIVPSMRFLDLGTGSGILGIACAKLGLHGEGFDVDEVAIFNALENREVNNIVADDFVLSCSGLEGASGEYDLIVANILAEPLREMSSELVSHLSGWSKGLFKERTATEKRGVLVLSGILTSQADLVEKSYTDLGLPTAIRKTREEWTALIFS